MINILTLITLLILFYRINGIIANELSMSLYYGWFSILSVFVICVDLKEIRICKSMILFLIIAVTSLLLNDVPSFFKADDRLISFVIIVISIGPLVDSPYILKFRMKLFSSMNFVMIGVVVVSFIGYLMNLNIFSGYSGFHGILNHSLLLGFIAGISFFICLDRFFVSYSKTKICYAGLMIISIIVCLLSASRTVFVAIIVVTLFSLYFYVRRNVKAYIKLLLMLSLLVVLLSPIIFHFSNNIIEKQKDKMENESLFSGRDMMWMDRWSDFVDSPLYGVGFASMNSISNSKLNLDGSVEPGSGWLFILSTMGLLGFLLFSYFIFKPVQLLFRNKYSSNFLLIFLLLFIAIHLFSEGYSISSGNFCFVYLWLLIGISKSDYIQKKN